STLADEDEALALSHKYHCSQPGFPLTILQQFGVRQTIDFFSMLGLPLTTLKEGLMYPMSLQAAAVLDIFELALEDRDVRVYCQNKVLDVKVSEGTPRFTVRCQTETGEQMV